MALDPMFMDFGLNLTKQYLAGRQTDVANASIALNNELAELAASEQQGYAATNYSQSLEELQSASINTAIQQMQAEAQARLDSAAYGVSEESQTLSIAREAGRTKAEIEQAKNAADVNYRIQRKAIKAQAKSNQKIAISKPSTLANVVEAGSQTYFRALKAGMIE